MRLSGCTQRCWCQAAGGKTDKVLYEAALPCRHLLLPPPDKFRLLSFSHLGGCVLFALDPGLQSVLRFNTATATVELSTANVVELTRMVSGTVPGYLCVDC